MVSQHPSITIISNLDAGGKPVLDNGGLGSYEVVWHTDNSYVAVPPAGSMLYALEVPVNGGGDTSFNNQYLAYEELPDHLKRAIEGKYQVHDSSRNSAGVLRPGVKLPTKPEEVEGPTHPLVRVHPVTGRRALYLGRRRVWPSNYIIGIPNEESERLLDELWAHATQPNTPGPTNGALATSCCGTTAAACTTARRSTPPSGASCTARPSRAKRPSPW
jgi:taurine dioxygenase